MNNLAVRCVHISDVKQIDKKTKKVIAVDWDYWEYVMFSSIYHTLLKVKNLNEIVLAVDAKNSWRYEFWPRYKEDRKKKREKSTDDFPWDKFFERYEDFLNDIKEHFPIKVMRIDKSEGDDIIGCLVNKFSKQFHIISTDKDFIQLLSDRVKLYDPLKKEYIEHPYPKMFLIEQCLIGQSKDSIFNIKTPLDWPEGKRKPGFGPKACEKAMAEGLQKFLESNGLKERFSFNRTLIDFTKIPDDVCQYIIDEYSSYKYPHPDNMWKYIKKKEWSDFIDNFTNLENKFLTLY